MKINRTVTIKLSREEVSEIIKEYLSKEGFTIDAKSIDFNITSVWSGYGRDKHESKEFTGCTVTCKMDTERKDK